MFVIEPQGTLLALTLGDQIIWDVFNHFVNTPKKQSMRKLDEEKMLARLDGDNLPWFFGN